MGWAVTGRSLRLLRQRDAGLATRNPALPAYGQSIISRFAYKSAFFITKYLFFSKKLEKNTLSIRGLICILASVF